VKTYPDYAFAILPATKVLEYDIPCKDKFPEGPEIGKAYETIFQHKAHHHANDPYVPAIETYIHNPPVELKFTINLPFGLDKENSSKLYLTNKPEPKQKA